VAHDFNNMLGVILGRTELALEQVHPSEPLRGALEEIRTAAERSANLTRQLLAFARKQTVAPKALDLNETVTRMLKMLQRLIGENIALVWLPGTGECHVKMDPSQIDQVLANLCVNSRDAIRGIGTLTIATANSTFDGVYCDSHPEVAPGEYVKLTVADNGCGMDKAVQESLFEPFFTTKEVGKGTGLGLATVYGIVKQNGGFINVNSEPGKGTTFEICLPRHTVAKTDSTQTKPMTGPVTRGRETILVVEDEPGILDMTKGMLERLGYTVLTASTPGEAIRVALAYGGIIHLLVTDVVMPEMNGLDLAKNLLTSHPALKRLFMSGYTADVIAHHGVLDEGVHFIQKPFSRKELAAKVDEALGHG
jgi:CheY-like chemotaxis protein